MSTTAIEYKLTEQEITEFKQRFNDFDTNGDGKITIDELKAVEITLGMDPSQHSLELEFGSGDIDGSGGIDFDEFCVGMEHQKEKDLKKTEKQIQNTFNLFDTDKNGFIDEIELKQGFDSLNIDRTDEEFDAMMVYGDTNGDRLLSYPEFYQMVLSESAKTPNSGNDHDELSFNLNMDASQYVHNEYVYIGVGVLVLFFILCAIRAVYRRIKYRNAKIYHALTVINEEMDEQQQDQML